MCQAITVILKISWDSLKIEEKHENIYKRRKEDDTMENKYVDDWLVHQYLHAI